MVKEFPSYSLGKHQEKQTRKHDIVKKKNNSDHRKNLPLTASRTQAGFFCAQMSHIQSPLLAEMN